MQRLLPAGPLARYVSQVWIWPALAEDGVRNVERLPDGSAGLIFRAPGNGHRGDLCATGAVSQAQYKRRTRTSLTVAFQFQPGGAYPFFGIPMCSLTDRIVPLEQLWGAHAGGLQERLTRCADGVETVRLLETILLARLEAAQDLELCSAVRVARAVRRLTSSAEISGVSEMARRVGLSERQLRRAFSTAVGVGPKEYLRMLRFQRAAASLGRTGGQVAAATGYYDQAHLIAEFRHLARMTPRAFANRHAPSSPAHVAHAVPEGAGGS